MTITRLVKKITQFWSIEILKSGRSALWIKLFQPYNLMVCPWSKAKVTDDWWNFSSIRFWSVYLNTLKISAKDCVPPLTSMYWGIKCLFKNIIGSYPRLDTILKKRKLSFVCIVVKCITFSNGSHTELSAHITVQVNICQPAIRVISTFVTI